MTQDFPERTGAAPAASQLANQTANEPFGREAGDGPGARGIAPGPHPVAEPPAQQSHGQTFVPVAALEAMLAVRHKQIFQFGHTLEADRAVSLEDFARHMRRQCSTVVEDLQFRIDPAVTQRHLAKLGALAMAIFDRFEAEKDRA